MCYRCFLQRTYNFIEVCGWFAARCDLILLLFDPAKLDISDEMKQVRLFSGLAVHSLCLRRAPVSTALRRGLPAQSSESRGGGRVQVIQSLKGHDDKVRVVLNKADQVDMQQLMRVYGALMWSLGKVFRSPEVRAPPIIALPDITPLGPWPEALLDGAVQDAMTPPVMPIIPCVNKTGFLPGNLQLISVGEAQTVSS
jgi:hypothetical protein